MSKKIFLAIVLLLIQLGFFPRPSFAVSSCKDTSIGWEPKTFLFGQTQYVMNFTIQDSTLETFKRSGQYVRLVVYQGDFDIRGTYTNPPVKIESTKFSIVLTGNLASNGLHTGKIQWSPTGNPDDFTDFCDGIVYQVGVVGGCTIDQSLPTKIPPNTSLAVKFVGKPDTDYRLDVTDIISFSSSIIATTKTDSSGQGAFPSSVIPGNNGDNKTLRVFAPNSNATGCSKEIKIDANASLPKPAPSGPVQPAPAEPIKKHCVYYKVGTSPAPTLSPEEMICGTSGGDPCSDARGPALKTAIGCIHTNPAEFVKDLLTWVIGIGGGIAFLMMLLGAFQMLTSAGNPETLQAGRDRLTSAVIGLLFIIFSVLLLQIIGVGILDIPGFK